jgi:hypothetical protein
MSLSAIETSTTLSAMTPVQIAPACPNIQGLVISNSGTGSLCFKFGSAPASAVDGTGLDPASTAGGQGGSMVLTGDVCFSDAIWAWSTAGTTVNVKQGVSIK